MRHLISYGLVKNLDIPYFSFFRLTFNDEVSRLIENWKLKIGNWNDQRERR